MSLIQNAYIVPGLPHILLAPDKNPGWKSLHENYKKMGEEIERSGAELILVYSTQWFSVIGHLFQVDPKPKWLLVDQNWYEYGEIPYEFTIDPKFGQLYSDQAKKNGLTAATVNYHGFPIDTGTVVALKFLNPNNRIPASIVSCNIYAEKEETRLLGRTARQAIEAYGKKTIVVCVTNLSNRFETSEIDPAHDKVSSAKDDEWNRKILEILADGRLEDVSQVAREFGREANADMGFKAIWWLAALAGEHNRYDGKVWDYQPVWGTGAALVQLTPSNKAIAFEKEFDEGPSQAEGQGGAGLETHNVADGAVQAPRQGMTSVSQAPSAPQPSESPAPPATIHTEKAPPPVGPYPHARRVGSMLYLSGIGPRAPRTGEIPGVVRDASGKIVSHDIEVQTRATIENIKTILEEGGSSLANVVDVTVYLTNMTRDFEKFNKVYGEYFATIQPTRTTVGVDSLPTPIAVELKVIAAGG